MGSLNGLSGLSGIDGLVGGDLTYANRVAATNPIAYWVQGEAAGLTAVDQILSPQQDGTYTGVTLGQPGIGDGNTCPLYDGANDYTDIHTATFQGRFNGAEGSMMVWARMSGAGVWVDGLNHYAMHLYADAANYVRIVKDAANNRLRWYYGAGGVAESVTLNGVNTLDWMQLGITWSASADEVRAFYNGVQTGLTQTVLGVWAGNLVAGYTLVGAYRVLPLTFVWNGYLAHAAVWDTAIAPAEFADLYTI